MRASTGKMAPVSGADVSLDALIGTDKPIGGRLILERVESKHGALYKTKCVGLPGEPCGFTNIVAGRVLLAGRCLWCVGCTQRKKRVASTHTPVGAEFVAARRRHRGSA